MLYLKNVDISDPLYMSNLLKNLFSKGFQYKKWGNTYTLFPGSINILVYSQDAYSEVAMRLFYKIITNTKVSAYTYYSESNDYFYIRKKIEKNIKMQPFIEQPNTPNEFLVTVNFVSNNDSDICGAFANGGGIFTYINTIIIDNMNLFSFKNEKMYTVPYYCKYVNNAIMDIVYAKQADYNLSVDDLTSLDLTETIVNFLDYSYPRIRIRYGNFILTYVPMLTYCNEDIYVHTPQDNKALIKKMKLSEFDYNEPCPLTGLPFIDKIYLHGFKKGQKEFFIPCATRYALIKDIVNIPDYELIKMVFVHIQFNATVLQLLTGKHRNYIEGYLNHGLCRTKSDATIVINLQSNQIFIDHDAPAVVPKHNSNVILCSNLASS